MARCISKHTTNQDVSGVVEELTKHKTVYTRRLRNPIKKFGTIYQRKGGAVVPANVAKEEKQKARKLDHIKIEAMQIKRRLNQSKDFLNIITLGKHNIRNSLLR